MSQQSEQAREILAKKRQQAGLRQEAMHQRVEEELHQADQSRTEAKARAVAVDQRLENENLQASMLERSEEELKQA